MDCGLRRTECAVPSCRSRNISPRERNYPNRPRLPPKLSAMVNPQPALVLPLMNHLVQQCMDGLFPTVALDMPAADNDLGGVPVLAAPCVVPEPALHSPRHPYRHPFQLTTKLRSIQRRMLALESIDKPLIRGMRPLGCPATNARRINGAAMRLELERELELPAANTDQASERSKQRCGPAKKFLFSSDQIRVVTSIVFAPMTMTFTDDGRPPRERLDTVPAVEITVPLFVCSM